MIRRVDWRTPPDYYEPGRAWLAPMSRDLTNPDLDPASSSEANKNIRARSFFDEADNGFLLDWNGTVFLNPPGGKCDADGMRVVTTKPTDIVAAAGRVGGIDAEFELQKELRARHVEGRPWCEASGACGLPPGHKHEGPIQSSAKAWWFKLAREVQARRVPLALFVGFNIEILQTTQVDPEPGLILPLDCFLCFPRTRGAYLDDDNKPVRGMTHASVIVGVLPSATLNRGEHRRRFDELFAPIGRVR